MMTPPSVEQETNTETPFQYKTPEFVDSTSSDSDSPPNNDPYMSPLLRGIPNHLWDTPPPSHATSPPLSPSLISSDSDIEPPLIPKPFPLPPVHNIVTVATTMDERPREPIPPYVVLHPPPQEIVVSSRQSDLPSSDSHTSAHLSTEYLDDHPEMLSTHLIEAMDHCYIPTVHYDDLLQLPSNCGLPQPYDRFAVPVSFVQPTCKYLCKHRTNVISSCILPLHLLQLVAQIVQEGTLIHVDTTCNFLCFHMMSSCPKVQHFLKEYNKFHFPPCYSGLFVAF